MLVNRVFTKISIKHNQIIEQIEDVFGKFDF
ncbi:MAG: hypothetical protein HeimC2_00330 [Candidatus Heimdallarchaeota archaeon LC_2]|nr:MAG: hypothetical protein HeimC2_00330 [Candidatus Heimdallarchaeota archaeon LC_2]